MAVRGEGGKDGGAQHALAVNGEGYAASRCAVVSNTGGGRLVLLDARMGPPPLAVCDQLQQLDTVKSRFSITGHDILSVQVTMAMA